MVSTPDVFLTVSGFYIFFYMFYVDKFYIKHVDKKRSGLLRVSQLSENVKKSIEVKVERAP